MQTDDYISVSELNVYIKSYLENNYFLQDVYVKGEISNFKRHQSGTLYFAIKDDKAAINVLMFPQYANKLKVPLKDGDLILIKGHISVYEARGTYSLNATEIIFDSKGMLLIQYEELKRKLASEGLFSLDHKKPIPLYPFKIGLITANPSAAIKDMIRTIKNRWKVAQIYVFPCLVQGSEAKYDICKKIALADSYNLDVLICGRGGGSIEDLWPFNEEMVAYAIYNCKTPIISAVGHEIDTTIADYVADARGLTPTDGAIKATSNLNDVLYLININRNKLLISFNNLIKYQRNVLNNLKNSYVLQNPIKIYENLRYKVDDLENHLLSYINDFIHNIRMDLLSYNERLKHAITKILNEKQSSYKVNITKLDSLSPLKIISRGYSYATFNHKVIKSVDDININDEIEMALIDGNVKAKIVSKEKKNGK